MTIGITVLLDWPIHKDVTWSSISWTNNDGYLQTALFLLKFAHCAVDPCHGNMLVHRCHLCYIADTLFAIVAKAKAKAKAKRALHQKFAIKTNTDSLCCACCGRRECYTLCSQWAVCNAMTGSCVNSVQYAMYNVWCMVCMVNSALV